MLNSDKNATTFPGIFVGFEGIDGAGKTTLIAHVLKKLIECGCRIVSTREPGGTPIGKAIRNILQHSPASLCSLTEAFLFAADRAEHIASVVQPALAQGDVVLSDRTFLSSIVYQANESLSEETILKINQIALQETHLDLVVFVDISPEEASARFSARPEGKSRFEARGIEYFKIVQAQYKKLLQKLPSVLVVDGTKDVESICNTVTQKILEIMQKK
ncbi:dTMP kinase [Candidatus Dependentiae bacterium]|nr:dTMP kinase [Candidatus Dependentiae bacterium]